MRHFSRFLIAVMVVAWFSAPSSARFTSVPIAAPSAVVLVQSDANSAEAKKRQEERRKRRAQRKAERENKTSNAQRRKPSNAGERKARQEQRRARQKQRQTGNNARPQLTAEERKARRERRQARRQQSQNGNNGNNARRQLTAEERKVRRERRQAQQQQGQNGNNGNNGNNARRELTAEERQARQQRRQAGREQGEGRVPRSAAERQARREEMRQERRRERRGQGGATTAAGAGAAVGGAVAAQGGEASGENDGRRDDRRANADRRDNDMKRRGEVSTDRREARERRDVRERQERRANAIRTRRRELRQEIRKVERREDGRERRQERRARLAQWERREATRRREDRRELRRAVRFFDRARAIPLRGRTVYRDGGVSVVVNANPRRFGWRAESARTYELNNGWREVEVIRPNGVRVVTVVNRNGIPIRRMRYRPNESPVVLFNNLPNWWGADSEIIVDVRPPRVSLPRERYVVEASSAPVGDVYDAMVADPVDELDRSFTLNQVLANETVRDYMPRIDVDTITFGFGSADVDDDQIPSLEAIGAAMEEAIEAEPGEVYLVEGHTDAVGSDLDNLELSDARAASVAEILTEYFEIPPENIVTQGFGEAYLKVEVAGANRANRRVAIRRITPLLSASEEIAGAPLDDDEVVQQ